MKIHSKIPPGDIKDKWSNYKNNARLISPANRSKYKVIVVGTGLAGSSAAASLSELGFNVDVFTYHDSPARAHSVAAQGGINAAKNYQNDGDSIRRMFADTVKGGDFRSREANVYRMAECSAALIDQAVAQGVPFAREYNGYLSNRSFGGVQVSRTFYARGQTGQQLLKGAYQALMKESVKGRLNLRTRAEMLDLIVRNNKACGIVSRNLITGQVKSHTADAVILATGGYGKIYYLSTLAMQCNATAIWRAHKKGALFAAPSWTQFHPTSLPQMGNRQSKLTLMSESLRNDGRIWVPQDKSNTKKPNEIPVDERDYFLERMYPAYGNLAPRDISSRAAKKQIDAGKGVGPLKNAVYLDFKTAIEKKGKTEIESQYGNLFEMYKNITGLDAYSEPMMIAPAAHFSMGGLWVDYELMSNVQGLFVLGEANFADHGANRLGANSLLQACVDGYYIAPHTLMNYLAHGQPQGKTEYDDELNEVNQRLNRLLSIKGNTTPDTYHKKLGKILFDRCGLVRNEAGLKKAKEEIKNLQTDFYENLLVAGKGEEINAELEKAGRVADYFELALLIVEDALTRNESCGAHFREEFQTPEGEAQRNDSEFQYVSLWETTENGFKLHKEELNFEYVKPEVRSYQ